MAKTIRKKRPISQTRALKSKTKSKLKVLLVVDRQFLPTALTLINSAQVSSEILCYAFSIGKFDRSSAPFQIASALRSVKSEIGKTLSIRVFMEGLRDTEKRNRRAGRFLESHDIEVRYGSTHAKALCVDSKYLLLGSTNLTHQSLQKNNETNLLLSGADALSSFKTYFERDWKGRAEWSQATLNMPLPLLADGAFEHAIRKALGVANKTVFFSIYVFDLESIIHSLIGAHRRGVKVTGLFHDHRSFALEYVRRNKRTIAKLKAAGLTGLFLAPVSLFTHSKFLVVDQKTILLGSGNWIEEDVKINPQLYVEVSQGKIAAELIEHLQKTIAEQGREA